MEVDCHETYVRVGRGLLVLVLVVGMLVSAFGATPASANPAAARSAIGSDALRISQVFDGGGWTSTGSATYNCVTMSEMFYSASLRPDDLDWMVTAIRLCDRQFCQCIQQSVCPSSWHYPVQAVQYSGAASGTSGTSGMTLPTPPIDTTANMAHSRRCNLRDIALSNTILPLDRVTLAMSCA